VSREPICGWEVADLLPTLVGKSLVTFDAPSEGGGRRFGMLESVRGYAAGLAGNTAERLRALDSHAAYHLRASEAATCALDGPNQARALRWQLAEQPDICAAFYWRLEWRAADDPSLLGCRDPSSVHSPAAGCAPRASGRRSAIRARSCATE
jgi:hypothetical protein